MTIHQGLEPIVKGILKGMSYTLRDYLAAIGLIRGQQSKVPKH
jgi:hypothetical protein